MNVARWWMPILAVLIAVLSGSPLAASSAGAREGSAMDEEVWALESAYFSALYRADYDGVLALVDPRFLGWPGGTPHAMDRDESSRFMKELVPAPTRCTLRIERGGLRLAAAVALTQYVLHVECPADRPGAEALRKSSRITHTWIRQDGAWRLLGGMSADL